MISKDISGHTFGRLTAIRRLPRSGSHERWLCLCACGKESVVQKSNLRTGHTISCGCVSTEVVMKRSTTHGCARHNNRTPEYATWVGMRSRCLSPSSTKYPVYGGRGIKICPRWMIFENFLSDMGSKPSKRHSIDRINNDGDYEPSNCRWVTADVQQNNTSTNRLIEYAGVARTLAQWSTLTGLPSSVIHKRISHGWTIEDALTKRLRRRAGGAFVYGD